MIKMEPKAIQGPSRVCRGSPKVCDLPPPRCGDAPEACYRTTNRRYHPPKAHATATKVCGGPSKTCAAGKHRRWNSCSVIPISDFRSGGRSVERPKIGSGWQRWAKSACWLWQTKQTQNDPPPTKISRVSIYPQARFLSLAVSKL